LKSKVQGVIFTLFGLGLTGESADDLYYGFSGQDFHSLKSALFLFFGITCCIYGYKQFI